MYLLNIKTLELEMFNDPASIPRYGILSHTWGEGEVLFSDLQESPQSREIRDLRARLQALEASLKRGKPLLGGQRKGENDERKQGEEEREARLWRVKQKRGWLKVDGCCKEASKHGLSYVWIDTCCINKDSSAELSEAINSMFAWYRDATICFAYLSDVTHDGEGPGLFKRSRWFSRGWTLQELIAPQEVLFFAENWIFMFTRSSAADAIARRTGIDAAVLRSKGLKEIQGFCVAAKMAWASYRMTTREEDGAYALMGLFGVNMPIIYGEGQAAAFFRLQRETFNVTGDHSVFAWYSGSRLGEMVRYKDLDEYLDVLSDPGHVNDAPSDLFPISPSQVGFARSVSHMPYDFVQLGLSESAIKTRDISAAYSAASHGLRVQLLLQPLSRSDDSLSRTTRFYLAHLACMANSAARVGIILTPKGHGIYQRPAPMELVIIDESIPEPSELMLEDIYITMPQPKVVDSDEYDQFRLKVALPTQVYLSGELVRDVGFYIASYAPGPRPMDLHQSRYSFSIAQGPGVRVPGARMSGTAITFHHRITMERFSVRLYMYSASIWVGARSADAAQLLRNASKPDLSVNDLRKEILIQRLPGGETVFVSVESLTPRLSAYYILVRDSFVPTVHPKLPAAGGQGGGVTITLRQDPSLSDKQAYDLL